LSPHCRPVSYNGVVYEADLPQPVLRELDGVSLTGPVSVARLSATPSNDSIQLSWTAFGKEERVKIWVTSTNNYKTSATDNYHLVAEVPAALQTFTFKPAVASPFYKVVWKEHIIR
jgi:hypothetical protein